jgi:hypothetical protein
MEMKSWFHISRYSTVSCFLDSSNSWYPKLINGVYASDLAMRSSLCYWSCHFLLFVIIGLSLPSTTNKYSSFYLPVINMPTLVLMEIKYCTRSLISSNFNVYASQFETINIIKGSIQTNNIIDVMNPLMIVFPLIYPFHQSHSLHPNFYDRILEWLEDLYLKNLHNKDKVVLSLCLPKYLSSKHYMIFLDPRCEEIDEHLDNCWEDGARWPWLMVMSGPHNIDKFSKLTYTLTCHYDPYHDQIT